MRSSTSADQPRSRAWARAAAAGNVAVCADEDQCASDSNEPVFQFDQVTVARGAAEILTGVSCQIVAGATAIVGPSGAGKSSLLRLLNRLADPAKGTIRFRGTDVKAVDVLQLRRHVWLSRSCRPFSPAPSRTTCATPPGSRSYKSTRPPFFRAAGLTNRSLNERQDGSLSVSSSE